MSTETAAAAVRKPGYRFCPSDDELVCYFLKPKVFKKPVPCAPISEIDIYKFEPEDLPGLSQAQHKSRDLVWYFFCSLDKKNGSGPQMNCTTKRTVGAKNLKKRKRESRPRTKRTTEKGYWKSTGDDRPVQGMTGTVGMKKTLVFYTGRARHCKKTNWFMHEYRLEDKELREAGILQDEDALVVCRVFQKNGSGSGNEEQYWASFVDEECDNNVMVLHKESANEGSFDDAGQQSYVEPINHEQNPAMGVMYGNAALAMEFNGTDSCNNSEDPVGFLEGAHGQNFLDGMGGNPNSRELHDNRELFVGVGENTVLLEEHGDQDLFRRFNHENYIEMNDIVNTVEADCPNREIVDNHLMDFDTPAHNQPPIEDGCFQGMTDVLKAVEADSSGFEILEDFLKYLDATEKNLHYKSLGSSCKQSENIDSTLDQLNLSMENPAMGVIYRSTAPVVGFNGTDSYNNSEDPVGFLEGTTAKNFHDLGENPKLRELLDNLSICVCNNTVVPEEYGDQDFFSSMDDSMDEAIISLEGYQTSQFNYDDCIELDDIFNTVEADCHNAPADSCKQSENVDSTLDQSNLSMEADSTVISGISTVGLQLGTGWGQPNLNPTLYTLNPKPATQTQPYL